MSKPSIIRAFNIAFAKAKDVGWDKLYVLVDLHDTVLEANFDSERSMESLPREWLPGAEEGIRTMAERSDFNLILWSCSYPHEIAEYVKHFHNEGVVFDQVNCNAEVMNTRHGFFLQKPYANIMLDDKAGFHYSDWEHINEFLKNQPILEQK